MMPIPSAQTVQDLSNGISSSYNLISNWGPQMQLETAQQIFDQEKKLEECKEEIQMIYNQGNLTQAPEISNEEYQSLLQQLANSASILQVIKQNFAIAQQLCSLADATEEALQEDFPDPNLLQSLGQQVKEIFSQSVINAGNKKAAGSLRDRIPFCERPMTPMPALKRSPTLVLPPPIPRQIEEDRQIKEEQDQIFEIHQYKDKFIELCRNLEGTPTVDFEMLINFYAGMKQSFENAQGALPKCKQLMDSLLAEAKKKIEDVIVLQQRIDEDLAKSKDEAEVDKAALQALQSALGISNSQFIGGNRDFQTMSDNVEAVFKGLTPNLKERIMDALNEVLKTKPAYAKPIPKTLLGQPFFVWCSSYLYRLEAVQKLIASLPPIPSGPTLSSQMSQTLERVSAPCLKHQHFKITTLFYKMNAKLLGWLTCLQDDGSSNQLYQMLDELSLMMSEGEQLTFIVGGAMACSVPDRLFFHLSCIHKHEKPDQFVIDDPDYAKQAMGGSTYPTTNGERRRAIQRTAIEVTLMLFEIGCIQANEETCLNSRECLARIQKIADEKDLPQELFSTFIFATHPIKGKERMEEIAKFQKTLTSLWNMG
jgi:hypothetical protein